ncbi:hypothetical protein M407DRAFT_27677 [Tulasnella calospora MUT 4182]|uniref:Beta-glucuronidase C-terminal domain-containing protein n=1 Tax=Tulasnella calospora MUT 4182 TaxID=1051891 RepID=A0A0C3LN90_9AGAM|nr:hypothetical protein M407DRAFT_27677 [Tulasnella calospora MUT 4182]
MSEVMEEEGSQAMDLLLTRNSTHTHGYALYKNGQPIKLALFNYITDPSGANDAQVNYPQQLAEREGQEVRLYRWFNCTQVQSHVIDCFQLVISQTISDQFSSGGRLLQGREQTRTTQCNAGSCTVTFKVPQFALICLDNQDSIDPGLSAQTWPTSVTTKLQGTTVYSGALPTNNGRGGV